MSLTSYGKRKLLDHLTGVASYTPPDRYLSLHTDDPGDAGSHANEVAASGYARLDLAGKMSAADSDGFSVNTVALSIGPVSADAGTVVSLGIEDAATAGNMIEIGTPAQPRTLTSGQTFQIPAGQFRMRAF